MTVQTFIITTVPNPAGAGNIYQVDGQNNPVLNLVRGGVYTFVQSNASNSNHPIAFKDGSGAAYTVGVVSTGTPGQAGAQTVFTVAANAPDSLRYYCTTHGNGMGNTISVTTLGEIQVINTGSQPNDGSGDDLRTAFSKVNQNFNTVRDDINRVSSANIGMRGYVDQGNTIQAAAITSANVGMKGYVDNAISTANIGTSYIDSAVSTANIGMRGYVDSIAYSDSDVAEFLTSGGIGNITVTGNISAQTVIADQGTFFGDVRIFGNIQNARVHGAFVGFRDIPQVNFGESDGIIGIIERGRHILTTSSTVSNIYIPDSTTVNWPIGSTVMVINHGEGNTNIIANTGVSLYMAGSCDTDANARTLLSHGVATLTNISANVWYIYGTNFLI